MNIITVREVTQELVVAAQKLAKELHSPNQVVVNEDWLASIIGSDSTVLFAAGDENGIQGLLVLVVFHTLVNPRALIETIAVAPEARRGGMARALVLAALAEARRRKVNTVRVATSKENIPANALFEKMGAVISEEYNWYDFILSEGQQ